MVTRRSLSDCSNSTNDVNEDAQDTVSVSTSDSDESTASHHGELVLSEDANKDKAGFSNIAVTNSTDIHFGNKTYYQGPVTIKQFLYANPQISNEVSDGDGDVKLAIKNDALVLDGVPDTVVIGNDNPSYVPDAVGIKLKNDIDKQINGDTHTQNPEVGKGTRWLRNISRQQIISILVAVVLLISLVTLLRVFLTRHQTTDNPANPVINPGDTDEQQSGSPALYPIDPSVNLTLPPKLKIISRREWLAQPANEAATPLQLPVPYVFIMETTQEDCTDQAACTFNVRYLQSFHIDSRGWNDIGYNFLIGGDGFAYEGRGWKGEGAHTYGYNSKSIGIAFVGTFNRTMPPERQIIAAKQLINIGLEKGYIDPNFKLLATRQVEQTKTPGLALYEDLQKWLHWAEKP